MPYLSSALFAVTLRAVPGSARLDVTTGWELCFDPELIDDLKVPELGRLIVHLTAHLVRDHARRAAAVGADSAADREWWNRCADAEINDDLAVDHCVPRIAATLPAELGCADGALAEGYYASRLAEVDDRDGSGHDCGSGAGRPPREGDVRDGSLDALRGELVRLGAAAEIQQAQARDPGSVPGGWLRWAETVRPSRIDWRRHLAAEIRRSVAAVTGRVDYTYRRLSRRSSSTPDVLLPSLIQPVPQAVIVCDTSGSMHDELIGRVLAEVEALLVRTGLRATQVRVLGVDTEVQSSQRVRSAARLRLAGGGGTDMGAGLDAAARLRPRPELAIVLTDGFTPWPDQPPRNMRVVVGVLTQYEHAPPGPEWARTIVIDE